MLLGGEGVEFGLAFFAEQAGELGERYRLFGRVDDGFDLGFQTHRCRVECINACTVRRVDIRAVGWVFRFWRYSMPLFVQVRVYLSSSDEVLSVKEARFCSGARVEALRSEGFGERRA